MNKANTLIITCIDFRFQELIHEYLDQQSHLGSADIISITGGTRDFILPEKPEHGEAAQRQLNLSFKLHNPKEIIFIDHQDCGGYAVDDTIPSGLSTEEDVELHTKHMIALVNKLEKKYTKKRIRFMYASLDKELFEVEMV